MSFNIHFDARGRLLVATINGRVAFSEADRQLPDRINQEIANHSYRGGDLILFDLSNAIFIYPSSYHLIAIPIFKARAHSRIAAVCPANHELRLRLKNMIDWFTNESEAIQFLESDEKLVDLAQYDHDLWQAIGEEVGPDECKSEGCNHLRVRQSVFCKRHHYKMLRGSDYIEA